MEDEAQHWQVKAAAAASLAEAFFNTLKALSAEETKRLLDEIAEKREAALAGPDNHPRAALFKAVAREELALITRLFKSL